MKRLRLIAAAHAVAIAGALLAGCDGSVVGKGEVPEHLYLGVSTVEAAAAMTECTTQQLNAILTFTGDTEQIGSFNDRVVWTSENPSIVFVSDGVTASPSGKVYAAGTLVALRPGAATISASYIGLHASIAVDVSELSSLRVDSDLTDIATLLYQPFLLKAVLAEGGPETDITSSATWRFDPVTANAYVGAATGVVQANSTTDGQKLTLVARLPECDREVSTRFRISPIKSLSTEYELGDQTELPEGYSDAVRVMANFDDASAPKQNITAQMTLESVDDDYVSAGLGTDAYYVTALDREGSGAMELQLPLDPENLLVTTKTWQVKNTALADMSLTPQDQRVVYPATGQVDATGTFEDGLVMPITRHVSFSSSDSALATVSSNQSDAGEVTTTNVDGDVEISATITSTNGDVLYDSVTVHDFANQYADDTPE